MNNKLLIKINELLKKKKIINNLIIKKKKINFKKFEILNRDFFYLNKISFFYKKYIKLKKILKKTNIFIKNFNNDEEIKKIAFEDIRKINIKLKKIEKKIQILIKKKEYKNNKKKIKKNNVIIEIRAATGGEEASIFVKDLFNMYIKYSILLGFKYEILQSNLSISGFNFISFIIKGKKAYNFFKFETGAHRVQRVPKTETQGRIHTSVATVLVLPEIKKSEIIIKPTDILIQTFRSSGAGGQHVNKTDSAVRIKYLPDDLVICCQDGRSQHDNKEKAMKILRARIFEKNIIFEKNRKNKIRKKKIGKGERSEKIRTYNFQQNRITDHRINATFKNLKIIMNGKMNVITKKLLFFEKKK